MIEPGDYTPISCSFYDYLEEAATLGKPAMITYEHGQQRINILAKVKTIEIKDKVEYLILEDDTSIGLNKLISFNHHMVSPT